MKNIPSKTTLQRLLIIAVPMVVSQASDTIMMFVDRLFLSRLGEEYLAASMSGGLTQFMVSSFFIGTIGYVTAVVAQYYGAGRKEKCAEATFQAAVLSALSYPILLFISPLARPFFSLLGQSALQVDLAYTYFHALIFGVIFLILRHALAGFFIGIGRTTVVMIANAAGMLVNIPLNYILIYGKLGFPALGLQGAAIGTILGNVTIFFILLGFYLRGKNRAEFLTHKALVFRPAILKTLLRFGVPAGIEMFLNVAAFNLFVQTMHSYGTKVAAAVTIAFNWDLVAFLPMLGMGHAVTALVGQNVGAGDLDEARKTAFTGLKSAWVYSSSMVVIFVLGAPALAGLFIPGLAPGGSEVSRLAVVMLRLASIYILADSAQIVFVGALRGAGDTRWVMAVSVIIHWVFAGAVIYLIKVVKISPVAAWGFFIGFIVLLGFTMFFRFQSGQWKKIKMIEKEEGCEEYHYITGACPEVMTEEPLE
jgi:MATE family multidrug resistance protein